MAQVQMQVYRGTSDYLDTISNVDGQFLYDEDTHQILLDNGTTREQYGGGNEKVYDTYAEAVADLANIAEGQTVFVKEGTSSDKPTITYAEWQQLSDIEKEAFSGYVSNFPEEQLNASAITYGNTNVGAELTSINTHLAYSGVNLLGPVSATVTPTQVSLTDDMSHYTYLSFSILLNNVRLYTQTIPQTSWIANTITRCVYHDGNQAYVFDINKISNTLVTVVCSQNAQDTALLVDIEATRGVIY